MSNIWTFTKMQGVGNDFIMLDGVSQRIDLTAEIAQALADRHFGIGADQILLVDTPLHPDADFRYRIFNADGSEVEHCGNGARCFVRFVHEQGLSQRNPLKAEICTGLIELYENPDHTVNVNMGLTSFEPERLPFDPQGLSQRMVGDIPLYTLPIDGHHVELATVAISNPHAVITVPDVLQAPVQEIGKQIESHPRFANRVNVGFMQICSEHEIRLRVFERGVGETLACGTGACAAVAAGIKMHRLKSPVVVHTQGGQLNIAFDGQQLTLTGPATTVFSGTIDIDVLLKNARKAVL
ncbi:diaminopimelate epimerase [Basilea psittacipulmonis]|uniref:Diaminopimelate epimerase n=1 Tax=Basilea psittacipulmonis DSM 24701 TaxID=1072685 RepID=A0A077DDM4_9BURK|nr:diaminopimelate epimerase [Basilea psittacipulmonis]AIL32719.1 diaminopimelate epimerase [Basilea psittacipulmonis DSM 24701]